MPDQMQRLERLVAKSAATVAVLKTTGAPDRLRVEEQTLSYLNDLLGALRLAHPSGIVRSLPAERT